MTKDQIFAEAMALDAKDRDELAKDLWQSITPGEFTDEQMAEVKRRIAAVDSGETQLIPGEDVMRELRQRFAR
jgi:putative addiction module component (TIGR02574 family)